MTQRTHMHMCRARSPHVQSWVHMSFSFAVWCRSPSGFSWCLPRLGASCGSTWLRGVSLQTSWLLFWHWTWTFGSRRTSFRGRFSERRTCRSISTSGSSWSRVGSTLSGHIQGISSMILWCLACVARRQMHIYASVNETPLEYVTHFFRSSGLRS